VVLGDGGIEVVKTGVDSEIKVNVVVGDGRTEVVSTGMDFIGSEVVVIVLDDDKTEALGNRMEDVDSWIEVIRDDRKIVGNGIKVEIKVNAVVVGDDRTETVGTGMEVSNAIEDEDSGIKSDVVLGIGVVVGTDVVEATLDEESINIEIEFVGTMKTVGSKMVDMIDGGIEVVGIEIEVVINDKFGTEFDVIIGTKVFVGTGTELVGISIVEDCEIEPEIVGTRIELVGITGKDEMNVIIELVGCDKEVEVVLMDTVELLTAEEVITSEDRDTKLELVVGVAVVVGNGVGGVLQNWYSHETEYVPVSLVIKTCRYSIIQIICSTYINDTISLLL